MSMEERIIKSVRAQQIFTLRQMFGIEAIIETEGGIEGRAICHSGISVGSHEVAFQYDGGTKWGGIGVGKAVHGINTIVNDTLKGMDVSDQLAIDQALLKINGDGKRTLGGNAIAAVSAAALKTGANALHIPLYRHIGGANATYLPVPGAPAYYGDNRWGGGVSPTGLKPSVTFVCYDFSTFSEASYAGWEIYQFWKEEMKKRGCVEGINWFWLVGKDIFKNSDEELFDLMENCIDRAGYTGKIGIQIDCAADTYYDKEAGLYKGLFTADHRNRDQMIDYYKHIVKNHPIVILEDPLHENDYEGHALLTKEVDIQIVGDDLFTTMKERVKKGYEVGAANAVLLKVNQVGSISEALDMIQYAYSVGYGVMPCDSRGEYASIADYCVGINAGSVREGAIGPVHGNRFIEIEKELGPAAKFWGKEGLKGARFHS